MNAVPRPDIGLEAFEAGDVDPAAFDHQAHVRVAWLCLDRYPLPVAIDRFTAALRGLTERLAATDKYHETITWFFLLLIAERRQHAARASWDAFRRDNVDLFAAGETLRRYYRQPTLASERAKRTFVLPDRIAA